MNEDLQSEAENTLSLYDKNPNYKDSREYFDSREKTLIFISERKERIKIGKEKITELTRKANTPIKPNNQLGALYDKHQERILQETVSYAANNKKKIIRYPTFETAAAIQKYPPTGYNADGKFLITDYHPKHQTILKKYEEMPKNIEKVLGIKKGDIRTVKDHLGNSWYEFDIPKSFLEGKGKIKAFTTLPIGAAAAIEGAKNGEKKVEN